MACECGTERFELPFLPYTGAAPLAKELPLDNRQPWRCSESLNPFFWVLKRVATPPNGWEGFSNEVVEKAGDWDSGELVVLDLKEQPIKEGFF